VRVLKAFIDRILEVNPLINCVVDERFSEALKDAEEADRLVASGTMTEEELAEKKPFLGVPISTKDCLKVKGLLNSCGLYYRKDYRAEEDSQVMKQMKKAGAIPFALTNVAELCMWWESANCVHGRTCNPYDTNRTVGGSSGGEGAIQSSAASPFGIGTDIGGSVRIPSFFNGIFGHKPSRFVTSNVGQHPPPYGEEQSSMNCIGPMSRYASDLKPMLKVMAMKEKLPALRLDEPVDVKNLKIFYQENDQGGHLVPTVSFV
jgi:fatty acid amide hydrolase 2